jgi:hypothetical protein
MQYRIIGGLSALVLAAGGLTLATVQQAGASQEFTLTAHQTNFEYVPVGGPATANPSDNTAPGIGDEFIIREELLQGTTAIGFDNVICTETFNNNGLCTAVFSITGKGDIHVTALIRDEFDPNSNGPSVFDGAIDGGTFAYARASGGVHLVAQADGDTLDTFQF